MTGGSLGIRCGSYGSFQQQLQHKGLLPTTSIVSSRMPGKLLKEKEKLRYGIFKFAGHRKVGMLMLCLISAAVFMWNLYVGKGEDSQDNIQISNFNNASFYGMQRLGLVAPPPPTYFLGYTLPQGHPCSRFTLTPPPAHMKRTGPRPCPVCYLPVEEAIALMPKDPSPSPVLKNLTYVHEENLSRDGEFGGSDFGGYPTLRQRNDSFDIRESMTVHCGFVRGRKPGRGTGFNIDDSDLLEMEQCNGVVVASAIFGNFDEIQQPKSISEHARKNVCFYMFVDEKTEAYLKNISALDISRKIGLWRVVIVRDLPYADARRSGKIPKLLLHRMFPNARYSLWIDGKLELVMDPYQILERFLWRKNATFAISRHYRRFDVFTEAEANKAAGKYDNASIDFQVEFYKKEGLIPYSETKLPITSDVPEGCVIIREHVPISHLFTCLWFNEVDRFTSRDQISFSTVRDKIMSKTNWTVNMFLDCERRNFVVQKYHRDVLKRMPAAVHPPPRLHPPTTKRVPARRGRERRRSKRHGRVSAGNKDVDTG